jgi:uncharacterized protein YqgC (DUF456 family)
MGKAMSDISVQTAIILIAGLVGCLMPVLPGPPLVWLGILYYAWRTNWEQVSIPTLVLLLVLAMAASTSNLWLGALGAKKTGASGWATLASFGGGVIGMIFMGGLPGLLIGSVGAIAAVEYYRHRDWNLVLKAGSGYLAGYLLSMLVEFGASLLMIGIFLAAIRF